MRFAEVSVNSPVAQRRAFSYAIPPGLNVNIGDAVWVPFGDKVLQGIVLELSPLPAVEETKEIIDVIAPTLDFTHVSLARWISEYYLSNLFDAVALMLPPGLAFISVSKKAWKLAEESKCPKYYCDRKGSKKSLEKTDTPFTPAIGLVIALDESLKMMLGEGLENIFKRHHKLAEATRQAMLALDLELFAPDAASDAVTAVKVFVTVA